MRRPSSYRQLYGWWESAVSGRNPPRHDGLAECGFYKTRVLRGGPWIPVRIYIEREIDAETGELATPEIMRMEIAGQPGGDPSARWGYLTPISRDEYARLLEAHRTSLSMQATHCRVDLTAAPVRP